MRNWSPWEKLMPDILKSSDFARCIRGNVAMTTAILLPTLLICIGAAVDYSHYYRVKTGMHDAALAAATAAFHTPYRERRKRIKNAERFFLANFKHRKEVRKLKAHLQTRRTHNEVMMSVTVSAEVPTHFMGMFGKHAFFIEVEAQRVFGMPTPGRHAHSS